MPNTLFLNENDRQILREIIQKSEKRQILIAILTSIKKRIKAITKKLASNAVKYCRKDSKDSFLRYKLKENPNNIEFGVEENNRGIPEKHQQNFFDMFYRYNTVISDSGLGLFIVKEVLAKIDGSIALESEPAKGSKFKDAVPLDLKIDYQSMIMATV
jgi:signal transduction histidine kinase